ncbi:hypothetical protein [Planktothricoides raciborskii]|uniref:Uncharacterized protein n=1 Tax=Planktothricoides raciborskii GIHE-MW2 TaxID=2792601 RepID=A0AAU8JDD5_9CYAN
MNLIYELPTLQATKAGFGGLRRGIKAIAFIPKSLPRLVPPYEGFSVRSRMMT